MKGNVSVYEEFYLKHNSKTPYVGSWSAYFYFVKKYMLFKLGKSMRRKCAASY